PTNIRRALTIFPLPQEQGSLTIRPVNPRRKQFFTTPGSLNLESQPSWPPSFSASPHSGLRNGAEQPRRRPRDRIKFGPSRLRFLPPERARRRSKRFPR